MNVQVMKLNPSGGKEGQAPSVAEFEKKDVWYIRVIVDGLEIEIQERWHGQISINTGSSKATIQMTSGNQFSIIPSD